ncbi:MAG: L,D-transpeptidase family protein [Candidatus Omnitrophica bacterium]|nr:L,D-transpeptidase family protein [Candidatus Omnitrophota bacterium]
MRRRWMLIGVLILIVTTLVTFIIFNTKKGKISRPIKQASTGSLVNLSNQARDLESQGNLLGAKGVYKRLINEFPNSGQILDWQNKIEDINIKSLFSSNITAQSILYEIKPGDTLIKIASEFNTTPDLIMKSNNLASDKILAGRKIKVWTAPFSMLVDKSQNILMLKSNNEIIKTYIVATGINNSTPVGTFKIINKLPNPTWFKAGAVVPPDSPENILGSRWLGFDLRGYGLHGTTDPQNLGKQITEGCIRLSNPDVEALYTIIPVGTEVTVVD